MDNVDFLADMNKLVAIQVEDCPRISSFPSLSGLRNLESVHVSGLKNLKELDGIVDAPNLCELEIGPVPSMPATAFKSLAKARKLKEIELFVGNNKRQTEAESYLPGHIKVL